MNLSRSEILSRLFSFTSVVSIEIQIKVDSNATDFNFFLSEMCDHITVVFADCSLSISHIEKNIFNFSSEVNTKC